MILEPVVQARDLTDAGRMNSEGGFDSSMSSQDQIRILRLTETASLETMEAMLVDSSLTMFDVTANVEAPLVLSRRSVRARDCRSWKET